MRAQALASASMLNVFMQVQAALFFIETDCSGNESRITFQAPFSRIATPR